ncbi:site-specific integrase [Candidatus Daviesbacteria bacterium]|nr:site-specific integrase [Candidatus Daviesbacteria bacterium]
MEVLQFGTGGGYGQVTGAIKDFCKVTLSLFKTMDKETLRLLIKKFKDHRQRRWKSAKTTANNAYFFNLLLEYLDTPFNREAIIKFFNYLSDRELSESTRRQAETAILAFADWLFYEDIIPKKWTINIDRTYVHRKPRILPSQTEVLELIKKATEPGRFDSRLSTFSKMEHRACLCFIVVACGGRNYETSQILREHVSISGNQLTIVEGKNGPRNAAIPAVPWLVEDLTRRVNGERTADELKTLSDRTHYKESDLERLFVVNEKKLEETMRKAGKLFGSPMNVHDLRRIFARDLKKNGASIDDIKDAMGHRAIETTMKYLEYDTSTQAKTLKNYSSEARKYRTQEEKVKELISHAWEIGRVIGGGDFKKGILNLRVKIN